MAGGLSGQSFRARHGLVPLRRLRGQRHDRPARQPHGVRRLRPQLYRPEARAVGHHFLQARKQGAGRQRLDRTFNEGEVHDIAITVGDEGGVFASGLFIQPKGMPFVQGDARCPQDSGVHAGAADGCRPQAPGGGPAAGLPARPVLPGRIGARRGRQHLQSLKMVDPDPGAPAARTRTRTGRFLLGFRRGRSGWQRDLGAVIDWARENGFASLDLTGGPDVAREAARVAAGGLTVGSVDLCDGHAFGAMLSADRATRAAAVEAARGRVEACAAAGVRHFFAVMVPENPARPRRENFASMVESYAALVPTLEAAGARVVVEGWPGPGALCGTPETCRALVRELPGGAVGFNYDPSHLVRMGIDALRFLREFAERVYHVHGKDTALADADTLYEFGREQPATFAAAPRWGGPTWRYTIPGRGAVDWPETLRVLAAAGGYRGGVSVELEDADFNGTEAGEKRGLILAREFLEGC